eukprot:TRINITY_DN24246_c0_g1_i1.p2 TRINITY_DN24246_c0_g1~~TRINITY_DN24246_c0_g1_i1.p2  ORF type:complete len:152 (+),score=15.72 TRINITY_DN24246_c0_g1_i1:56-457(+)
MCIRDRYTFDDAAFFLHGTDSGNRGAYQQEQALMKRPSVVLRNPSPNSGMKAKPRISQKNVVGLSQVTYHRPRHRKSLHPRCRRQQTYILEIEGDLDRNNEEMEIEIAGSTIPLDCGLFSVRKMHTRNMVDGK